MTSGTSPTLRVVRRLRNLSEAECYARCYGWRADETTVTRIEPQPPRRRSVSGELLRVSFQAKLDAREPEAA